jgi:hypothetical protein
MYADCFYDDGRCVTKPCSARSNDQQLCESVASCAFYELDMNGYRQTVCYEQGVWSLAVSLALAQPCRLGTCV